MPGITGRDVSTYKKRFCTLLGSAWCIYNMCCIYFTIDPNSSSNYYLFIYFGGVEEGLPLWTSRPFTHAARKATWLGDAAMQPRWLKQRRASRGCGNGSARSSSFSSSCMCGRCASPRADLPLPGSLCAVPCSIVRRLRARARHTAGLELSPAASVCLFCLCACACVPVCCFHGPEAAVGDAGARVVTSTRCLTLDTSDAFLH